MIGGVHEPACRYLSHSAKLLQTEIALAMRRRPENLTLV